MIENLPYAVATSEVGDEDQLVTDASDAAVVQGGKGDDIGQTVHHSAAGIGGGDGVGGADHSARIGGGAGHHAGIGGGDCIGEMRNCHHAGIGGGGDGTVGIDPLSACGPFTLPLLGGGYHQAPARAGGAEHDGVPQWGHPQDVSFMLICAVPDHRGGWVDLLDGGAGAVATGFGHRCGLLLRSAH